MPETTRPLRTRALRLRRSALAVALAACGANALAANWFVETGVRGDVTATDNASFAADDQRRSDVIFTLTPYLTVRGEGRRLRVAGTFGLTAITYVNGSEDSAVVPTGALTANLEAIERWLFLDAGLTASRSLDNPLAPRPDGASTFNRATTTTARLSPYIDRTLPNDIRLVVRSDNSWTETRGDTSAPRDNVYAARHSISLSREPQRLGWQLEAQRTDERAEGGIDRVPAIDVARLRLRYALGDQVVVGARGGYERSDAFNGGDAQSFAGVELGWRPTERTRLDAFWEDRSFGDGYRIGFTHRSPRLAWDLSASRDLTTFGESFIELPATGDLAGLLDAALRTRIVDPIERARAVEDFLVRRGLPRSLLGPTSIFSDQLLVQTARRGTVTFIGTRSTLALSGFYQRDASPSGSTFSVLLGPVRDLAQQGASLAYSLRLTSLSSATASAGWTRTRDATGATTPALGTAGDSRQQTYRLQTDYQLAPRTTGFVGARHQIFESDVINDSRETAIFAGLGHRF